MKKIIALALIVFTVAMLTFAASAETITQTDFRIGSADPWMFYHDGKYYLTRTGNNRVAVYYGEHLTDVDDTNKTGNEDIVYNADYGVYRDPTVDLLFGEDAVINGTWSPEIHYFSEEEMGENAGWYMYVALHKKNTVANDESRYVRMVVLKSRTDDPFGPYGNPCVLDEYTLPTENYSQPLLEMDGSIYGTKKYEISGDTSDLWGCGQTILRINEGPYKGIYTMWVSETGRNIRTKGEFYQNVMIAKLNTPWKLGSEPVAIISADQTWETSSASETNGKPEVVEGATPIYGKNGEVFLIYSGSGYWTDYALGQMKWNGGDPCDKDSWEKLSVAEGNPVFDSNDTTFMSGAGHASFITDTNGNGFAVYHAYHGSKDRGTFIEPYEIDYDAGIVRIGLTPGVPNDPTEIVNMEFKTVADGGSYLTAPDLYALGRTFSITLNMVEANAEGFIIYKSTDGEVFEYLTTTVGSQYVDEDVTEGETYYYRAYAYREEEISPVSETVSQKATTLSPFTESATADGSTVTVTVYAEDNYDSVRLYRSDDGTHFGTHIQEIENVKYGETLTFTDKVSANGTYKYVAFATNGGYEYMAARTVSVIVDVPVSAPTVEYQCTYGSHVFTLTPTSDYDELVLYISSNNVNFVKHYADFIKGNGQCLFLVEDLKEGTYYYYVTAIKDGIESEASAILTVEIIIVTPPTLKMSVNDGKISLTATAVEDYDSISIVRLNENNALDIVTVGESGPLKAGETYTILDTTAVCGKTYQYTASGNVGSMSSDTSNAVSHTAGHSYELTEEEIPATTESVGKTAVYTCSCGDSYGGDEIPMLKPAAVGDVTNDGVVNMLDVLRILKSIAGMDVEVNTANADVNGDGELSIEDALAIIKLALNK